MKTLVLAQAARGAPTNCCCGNRQQLVKAAFSNATAAASRESLRRLKVQAFSLPLFM